MKLRALLCKDFLLLIRDFWGLVLLFLMPWALVILMTYLQDSTFKAVGENNIPLYLLDADRDSLGSMIGRELSASQLFEVFSSKNGETLTEETLRKAVAKGDYMVGIIVPANATEELRKHVRANMEQAFGSETDSLTTLSDEPINIEILIDPMTRNSFRSSLSSSIKERTQTIQNKLLFSEITQQVNQLVPTPVNLNFDTSEWVQIRESYAQSGQTLIIPTSVQHNVPGWSMFAIFFIVISLASNMIRERTIGCFSRLMTMPCSVSLYLFSKVCVYMCVCMLQLALIILTGMYLIPMLGLPALKLGHSLLALFAVSIFSSLAAIGYGLAIGSIARTDQQASVFGAVSVVILAAIGGVWIPTLIMPRFMQLLSHISPLNWGLSGFNAIFVRDAGIAEIWPSLAALFVFFAITISLAIWGIKRRRK